MSLNIRLNWVFGDDAFAQYLSGLYWGKIKSFIVNAVV